jgi:hypothetical protein
MALSDPQSVTIGSAISLPRIVTDDMSATYRAADGNADLFITHTSGKNRRSVVRINRRKVAADPLTAVNTYANATATLTITRPEVGFTEAELVELITGLTTWLTAGTNANAKKILGLES